MLAAWLSWVGSMDGLAGCGKKRKKRCHFLKGVIITMAYVTSGGVVHIVVVMN